MTAVEHTVLDRLRDDVAELSVSVADWTEGMDADALILLLWAVRAPRQALADVEAAVEALAARAMTSDRIDLPGLVAERKGGAKRSKWDHQRLSGAVVEATLIDRATGEASGDMDTAWRVRDAILDAGALSYWRTGKLKPLGIKADDYCEVEYGRRTVHTRAGETP